MRTVSAADRFRLNEPLVASQEIDGETILIHFDSGHYFCANPVGSLIIAQLAGGASTGEAAAVLHAQYLVDATDAGNAVAQFVDSLLTEQLIVAGAGATSSSLAAPAKGSDRVPFEQPALQKFDDLQDLLMLDPIHDVDQAGWPMPAPVNPGQP